MLNILKNIIDSAALSGVAINITSTSNTELAIVLTPKLAALTQSGQSEILADRKANAECDFRLRQALSTPWVVSGTPESIEEQLSNFLQSAGTPLAQANQTMNNSSFIDALNNATKSVEDKAPAVAPKAAKKEKRVTAPASPVVEVVEAQEPPAVEHDLFNDFDDIDSI